MSRRRSKRATHLSAVATIDRHEQADNLVISGYTMRCGCWSEQPEHTCRRRTGQALGCTCSAPGGYCECEKGVAS
jgi:hypothetical protein